MKNSIKITSIAGIMMMLSATSASAVIFDFIDLVDNKIGEKGFVTLSGANHADLNHFGLSITGHAPNGGALGNDNDDQQYAYLDKKNSSGVAGLGVCKDLDGSNECTPSSDDNVTTSEWLEFVFDQDVVVNNLWFNNNHDATGINGDPNETDGSDKVDIGTTSTPGTLSVSLMDYALMEGYAGEAGTGIGSFLVKKGDVLQVAYNNEQFYVSAMEVSAVPVPAAVWLFGTALIGFVGLGRRTSVT